MEGIKKDIFASSISQLTQSISFEDMVRNLPKQQSIKKINDWNVFPCYNCAGDNLIMLDCDVCDHKGYLKGNHPMVKMIQQIIDSKFKGKQQKKIEMSQLKNTLGLEQNLASSSNEQQVHRDFSCDDCGVIPIRGKRFHCKLCPNFDLCQKCHNKKQHCHQLQRAFFLTQVSGIKKLNKQTQRSMLFEMTKTSVISSRLSRC